MQLVVYSHRPTQPASSLTLGLATRIYTLHLGSPMTPLFGADYRHLLLFESSISASGYRIIDYHFFS